MTAIHHLEAQRHGRTITVLVRSHLRAGKALFLLRLACPPTASSPGRALTPMVVPRFAAEHLANPGTPIGRYSDPEEVAEVVEFLCSERNTYTTGSVWSVKGATG